MMRRAALLLLLLVPVGCIPLADPQTSKEEPSGGKSGTEFAADRAPQEVPAVPFNGKRAMGYLEELCKIGPRISGTEGMKKQQKYLTEHFEKLGGKVTRQEFKATQRSVGKPTEMCNLIVSWHPDRARRILLCTHYDTRPIADQEEDERRWREPFISANDGGSGVAFLMELANHMKEMKTSVGVDFVFFDGEEFIYKPHADEYFFGSERFAQVYRRERSKDRYYVKGILLDMMGGKDPHFPVEPNSWQACEEQVREIWATAKELKCTAFEERPGTAVQDDHVALNWAGIPTVDLIDFSYRHWHRLSDTPENCSAQTLEQVARVLTTWIQRAK